MTESRALTIATPQELGFRTTDVDFIKRTVAKGASDDELRLFLYQAHRTGLDPLSRQIYCIVRHTKDGAKATIQTGIDGYRLIAARTGGYAGSDDYRFDDDYSEYQHLRAGGTRPLTATATVWKLVGGARVPFTATARWDEYCPAENAAQMWRKMPYLMLGKCFDDQTEILTDRGFQKFSEMSGRAMYVAEDGLHPCEAKPFAQPYDGPMITFESDDLNFRVTPNHDMVTTDGKIEAGDLYEQARARPKHWIPRCVAGGRSMGIDVADDVIRLAAAYVADGSDAGDRAFRIEVSRPAKVTYLENLGLAESHRTRVTAGDVAHTATRTITTRANKQSFQFARAHIHWLVKPGKQIDLLNLQMLSRAQCRVFVDALISFDGHVDKKSGVRRFYSSRPDHMAAFELAAVAAGYAVSSQTVRRSDISRRPNYYITISSRSEIPVTRWGRSYHGEKRGGAKHTGLELTPNASGRVWCITVPSGVIVVRRHGFSMLCGNCAEALALRKAFPAELSGLYVDAEMDQAGPAIEAEYREIQSAPVARVAPPSSPPPAQRPPARGQEVEQITDPNDPRWVQWIKLTKAAKDNGVRVPVGLDKLPAPGPSIEAASKSLLEALSRAGVDVWEFSSDAQGEAPADQDAEDLATAHEAEQAAIPL